MLTIGVTHGPADAGDISRARRAAAAVFAAHNVRAVDAQDAHDAVLRGAGSDDLLRLAEIWEGAYGAANCALTEGWADPDGAACELYAS